MGRIINNYILKGDNLRLLKVYKLNNECETKTELIKSVDMFGNIICSNNTIKTYIEEEETNEISNNRIRQSYTITLISDIKKDNKFKVIDKKYIEFINSPKQYIINGLNSIEKYNITKSDASVYMVTNTLNTETKIYNKAIDELCLLYHVKDNIILKQNTLDSNNRIIESIQPNTITKYNYNENNCLIKKSIKWKDNSKKIEIYYSYNEDNRLSVKTIYINSELIYSENIEYCINMYEKDIKVYDIKNEKKIENIENKEADIYIDIEYNNRKSCKYKNDMREEDNELLENMVKHYLNSCIIKHHKLI